MEIRKEGEQWLANQKTAASYFGISVQHFQRWGYEPVRKQGRSTLYDVRAIQNDLDDRSDETREQLDLTAERARLAKEQADKTEMENRLRRGELAEFAEIEKVVISVIHATKAKILAIPAQLSRYLEHQTSQNIEAQLNDALHDALEDLSAQVGDGAQPAKKANGKSVGRRGKKAKRRSKRSSGAVAH